jgi:vacuolar protein sorting-associated protein 16
MMDDYVRLNTFQQQMEKELDNKVNFVGLSVNETIHKCLTVSLPKKAEKARADWKVPDKRSVRTGCICDALEILFPLS